ncbi:MAG: tol-pal system protein YbgF [Devosia sp.]|nr:tol-pal system protein YbgF [Devosia sp.]
MSLFSPFRRPERRRLVAAVLLVGLVLPMQAAPVSAAGLFGGDQGSQSARDAAQLTLRIQDLEQQVRDLTGQVQGLQFQLTQLQTLIDRTNQDNDFRFKQLEGGRGGTPAGKSNAADQSGGVTPSEIAPQNPTAAQPAARQTASAAAAPIDLNGGAPQAGDSLGPSYDPLVGKGKPGVAPSSEEVPLGPSSGRPTTANPAADAGSAPVTKQASLGGSPAQNPAAQAQYKSGYDAIVKGDYAGATSAFKVFIKQYPDDPQAADATNWLGEALLQQQDYVDAADVLVTGYKTYPTSPRAPDMLLKLGIALAGAQQQDAACKTFGLLAQKYPNTTTAFKTRLKQEMARGKCPG